MTRQHIFAASALVVALAAAFGGNGSMAVQSAQAQEAVRPEVGKPLQAAHDLMRTQKYKDAAAKVREADAVPNKTANEAFLVERMRGSIAAASGDYETAMRSFEAQINSGKLNAADQLKVVEALAGAAYRAKDYKKAGTWAARYIKDGGTNPQIRALATQSLYLGGDYAGAAKQLQDEFAADEKAGKAPSEERLQMLANCQLRMNDNAGYVNTIERLVTSYPKKQYWADLISRLRRKPGFSDRFALDVYRLQLATGNLASTSDYMEMSQLALQAGYAGEAKKVVDAGYAAGALGKGAEAERHKRLRDLTVKRLDEEKAGYAQAEQAAMATKDGNGLVSLGYALAMNAQAEKGVQLIERGIAKGGLKRPEDAKLLLGQALAEAGQKQKAVQTLHTVRGNDGSADLARLWALLVSRS